MSKFLTLGVIVLIFAALLYACNLGGAPETQQAVFSGGDGAALTLNVQAQSGTFNTVGQTIVFRYTVTNAGNTALSGPVTVTDTKVAAVSCPAVNTVGNLNDSFDPTESLDCAGSYQITQADLNAGSVTSTATASAGGITSNTVTTNVPMTLARVLALTVTASPTSYSNAVSSITLAYTIQNTGATALGPAQFTLRESRIGTINCGGADTTLAAGASFSCTSVYNIQDSDRALTQLTFTFEASGGGATTNQPFSVTVTNTTVSSGTPPSGLTKGATIQHDVQPGEWMLQIARCYGADFNALRNANPQVKDPAKIWPVDVLTVPNIGSNGKIYGPPCVIFITAQAGDTWESIAQRYNARVDVLKEANQTISTVTGGDRIRVPINSADGNPVSGGSEPIPLSLTAGSKVTLSGTITPSKGKERYVFTAAQGQTLSAVLTAPDGGLELAVTQVGGNIVLKPQNNTLTWSGSLPANGSYYVDVVNVSAADRRYTLELALAAPVSATERAADIYPGSADSNPSYLAVFNNVLYFNAVSNDNAGAELWKYDAAANSASRVADIFPGAEGSNPAFLADYNGALYFSANGNDGAGVELWRFNGSNVGRLTDINPAGGNANPAYMTVYNGFLYFSANDGVNGTELWKTDGVTTTRVADIYPGAGDSNPSHLAEYKGALYFSAVSNDTFGTELWKYDGTNPPVRVTDINAGVGNANPAYLQVWNDVLYFSANDGVNGTELWKYDGTNAALASNINPGAGDSAPSHLAVFNGVLYFSANGGDGKGFELWRFNGTSASLAADVNPSGDSFPSYLTSYNNRLYFSANGGDGAGKELWRFNAP
ncbi:MAG: ELWxxDGT repeat protein [Chloroflexota bacterium]